MKFNLKNSKDTKSRKQEVWSFIDSTMELIIFYILTHLMWKYGDRPPLTTRGAQHCDRHCSFRTFSWLHKIKACLQTVLSVLGVPRHGKSARAMRPGFPDQPCADCTPCRRCAVRLLRSAVTSWTPGDTDVRRLPLIPCVCVPHSCSHPSTEMCCNFQYRCPVRFWGCANKFHIGHLYI